MGRKHGDGDMICGSDRMNSRGTNQRCTWIDMEHQQPWVLLGGELPTNRFCGSYPSSFSGIRRVNLTHMFCFLMFPVNVPMEIYPIPVFTGCFLSFNKSW